MREIKFKIWADDRFYDKCLVGNTTNVNDDKWTCPLVWLEDRKEWVHCDNGIICEFTRLHDKNGKEIYEGDIVKYNEFWAGDCHYNSGVGQILWDDEETGFYLTSKDTSFIDLFNLTKNLDAEVIGNIYENPELLKGADNIE